ncbi:HWE histidine kinase domain-containing protein [Pseudoroseomonas cervicalis]|uniref:HWE histidine kinase domain-containing protein n=1 Tax=Teichococcus cervicalis TaxID=204525 RepID=UPI0022F15BB0|nr:HWE histidine kinase domain-containing protein [Pseudoroseomonas cervicalis]WBV44364.1 PAS domain S-box protein [Pseudoroseomonas cervicalis]
MTLSTEGAGQPGVSQAGCGARRPLPAQETEQQVLRAAAARLRQVLAGATHYAIITLDLEGRVTGWNEGARAILGYEEAEILGRSGELFFTAEDRAAGIFLRELCRAMEEGRAVNERWHLRRDGSRFWASGLMMRLLDGRGQPEGFLNLLRDSTDAHAEAERRALLLAEAGHRIKNVLAAAQAVVTQTLRQAGVPVMVQRALEQRLVALAESQTLLAGEGGDGAPLAALVQRALAPYDGPGRVAMDGPPLRLPAPMVQMLHLALHELATNAARHGALSAPAGSVEIAWHLQQTADGARHLTLLWRERGGPPVRQPWRRGFGSRLLERELAPRLEGTVALDYRPEGLECRIRLPFHGLDS